MFDSSKQINFLITEGGILNEFKSLLETQNNKMIVNEICWAISNLAAEN